MADGAAHDGPAVQSPYLLDHQDLARVLRLRSRPPEGGFSSEAARKYVSRHPDLQALAIYIDPGAPRWRLDDVFEWVQRRAGQVAPCRRGKAPQRTVEGRTAADSSGQTSGE